MGTQSQNLTTPRTWASQAVQPTRHGTCKLTMSFPRRGYSCPRGFLRPPRPRSHQRVWPWQPKTDRERQPPLCPQLSPSGSPLRCCGLGAWSLLGPNPNPNRTPIRDPPPQPKPASNPNPASEPPSGAGPHLSPRGRSRDWSRFSPGDVPGPNPNPS